jgi:hypothetical protein
MDQSEVPFGAGPSGGMKILADLIAVRNAVGYIAKGKGRFKSERDKTPMYMFRGIDDALNYVGPALASQGVTVAPIFSEHKLDIMSVTTSGGDSKSATVTQCKLDLWLFADDGSWIKFTTLGEGREYADDKGTAKCQTMAMKIAIFFGFMIPVAPDMLDDSDADQEQEPEATATRAPSAIKPEDSGANRSDIYRKACKFIDDAIKAGDVAKLKQHNAGIEKTTTFTNEEKASLHRRVSSGINTINEAANKS